VTATPVQVLETDFTTVVDFWPALQTDVVDGGACDAVVAPGLVKMREMDEVDVLDVGVGVAPAVNV
jgi:hypothetical protein